MNTTTRTPQAWTTYEDSLLIAAVAAFRAERGTAERTQWQFVADRVPGKRKEQCLQRYTMSLAPGVKKGYWAHYEDEQLTAAVESAIANVIALEPALSRAAALKQVSWPQIATCVAGRSSKKCKERWQRHLTPDINRAPFSAAEEALLLQLHSELGSKWVAIAARLDRRTSAMVRNRTQALLKKQQGVKRAAPACSRAQQPASNKRARACPSPTSAAVVFELSEEEEQDDLLAMFVDSDGLDTELEALGLCLDGDFLPFEEEEGQENRDEDACIDVFLNSL